MRLNTFASALPVLVGLAGHVLAHPGLGHAQPSPVGEATDIAVPSPAEPVAADETTQEPNTEAALAQDASRPAVTEGDVRTGPAPSSPSATQEPERPLIEFFGTVMLYADYLSKDNSGARGRLNAGTTGLGVRGSIDSEYGVAAIYQVEMGLALDETGIGPSPSSAFPLRNSAVGVEGDFGSVRFGNWDTPLKSQILDIGAVRGLTPFNDPLLLNPGNAVLVTINAGGYTGRSDDAGFIRRQGNLIQYWSPTVAGFSLRVGYSLNETKQTVEGGEVSPHLLSAALRYEEGGLSLRYGVEWHHDYFGLSNINSSVWGEAGSSTPSMANDSADDLANVVVASYRFGTTRISALAEYLLYNNDDTVVGQVDSYGRMLGQIYAEHTIAPFKIFGQFSLAEQGRCERVGGADCDASGLGAIAWSVGGVFALNHAASIFAAFQMIDNQEHARYATFPPVGGTAEGEDYISGGLGFIIVL